MIICPVCGVENRDTAHFCQNCAESLVKERQCPICQVENPIDARYCQNCAAPLRGDTPINGLTGRLQPDTLLANRYKVIRKLGHGGMGAVYLVGDERLGGKFWAVKEMSDAAIIDKNEKADAVKAFQNEATLLASLSHPNLAKVVDYFEESGRHYLVMDYVDGRTLAEKLDGKSEPFYEAQVIDWALQLCDVLGYLHNQPQPVIFRDLKPGNVIIDQEGQVKLIDFGIARLFKPGKNRDTASFGTAGYSPPEQYGRGQTDARSDIYALGASMHQLLTLRDPQEEPFKFPPVRDINPLVSNELAAAVSKAVELDPDDRWQTTSELSLAIKPIESPALTQPILPSETVLAAVTEPAETTEIPSRVTCSPERSLSLGSRRVYIIGGVAAVIVTLTVAGVLFRERISGANLSVANLPIKSYSYHYTSNRDGEPEIYRLDESGEAIRVTNTPHHAGSWSPVRSSGGRILFTSNRDGKREIYRIEDSGQVSRVTHTPGDAESWSPAISGSGKILFVSNRDGKREIYRIDDDGSTARVTHTPGGAESWSPSISRSGRVLFVSDRDGKREIYRLGADGNTVRVTNTPGFAESWAPSISAVGNITYVSNRDGKREIYRLDGDGNTSRVTNTPGNAESWGPDLTPGGKLIYTSNRAGKIELYRMADEGEVIRVTFTPSNAESWTYFDE